MSASYLANAERQCSGKHTYVNSNEAKRAAKRTMTKVGGSKLSTYRCPHCGFFHNGHTPSWRKYGQ
jgi:rubrerythrin